VPRSGVAPPTPFGVWRVSVGFRGTNARRGPQRAPLAKPPSPPSQGRVGSLVSACWRWFRGVSVFSRGFRGFPWLFPCTEFVSVFRGFRGPRNKRMPTGLPLLGWGAWLDLLYLAGCLRRRCAGPTATGALVSGGDQGATKSVHRVFRGVWFRAAVAAPPAAAKRRGSKNEVPTRRLKPENAPQCFRTRAGIALLLYLGGLSICYLLPCAHPTCPKRLRLSPGRMG
jgi:hypothetical protein